MTDSTSKPSSTYTLGHSPAVLSSHSWRTVANSASYLLPHLDSTKPIQLLDVGCGPGTLTLDFATHLPHGHVTGLDLGASVIDSATALAAEKGVRNVEFLVADILALPETGLLEGRKFDIIHAHQTICHIPNSLGAIQVLKQYLKPTGILALRDAHLPMITYPRLPLLERYFDIFRLNLLGAGCSANTGVELLPLVSEAGFKREHVNVTAGTWCFSDKELREWWGETNAKRIEGSEMMENAIKWAGASREECLEIARAWREWTRREEGQWVAVHFEVLARLQ